MKRLAIWFLVFVALSGLFVWWLSGITLSDHGCDARDDSCATGCP